jgi:hypothetical protein
MPRVDVPFRRLSEASEIIIRGAVELATVTALLGLTASLAVRGVVVRGVAVDGDGEPGLVARGETGLVRYGEAGLTNWSEGETG